MDRCPGPACIIDKHNDELVVIKEIRGTGYCVSKEGIIYNSNTGRRRKYINKKHYNRVQLTITDGPIIDAKVNTLVAKSWVPNPQGEQSVVNIDGDINNAHADNLKWCHSDAIVYYYLMYNDINEFDKRIKNSVCVLPEYDTLDNIKSLAGAGYKVVKDVVGFEGSYRIDTDGNVYSVKRTRFLVDKVSSDGYNCYTLNVLSKTRKVLGHTLVAECFLARAKNKTDVLHKDGAKHNNNIANLAWATKTERANNFIRNNPEHLGKIGLTSNAGIKIYVNGKGFTTYAAASRYVIKETNDTRRSASVMLNRIISAYVKDETACNILSHGFTMSRVEK